jgi:Protein of unknown function (DUF5661)
MKREFSVEEAQMLGRKVGIDFNVIDIEEFRKGLAVELEHGTAHIETNVTDDNEIITAKIAWAHLMEIPDYYTRLLKMEKEAES